jgi:hypothetical protein
VKARLLPWPVDPKVGDGGAGAVDDVEKAGHSGTVGEM